MADAEAICEAVNRPNMHFVTIKHVEQQAILSVHRTRQGLIKARTAQANQIRGLLSEFGIVIPKSIHLIAKRIPGILENAEKGLSETMRQLLRRLNDYLAQLNRQVCCSCAGEQKYTHHLGSACQRLTISLRLHRQS